MTLRTTRQEDVKLTDPLAYKPPQPVLGCDVCGALARQIARAEDPAGAEYDLSKATDFRVEMTRHQRVEVPR